MYFIFIIKYSYRLELAIFKIKLVSLTALCRYTKNFIRNSGHRDLPNCRKDTHKITVKTSRQIILSS